MIYDRQIENPLSPDITVILPVYNGSAFLARCLTTLTAGDYLSFDCIVVNDGSTDGSGAIARGFPVRVLDLAGGPFGPAYARNRGAEAARGEILFFLDADVIIAPDALRRIAMLFRGQPALAAVFGSYDASPEAQGVVSQYRNLLHHFVHQTGQSEASTFWAGCGAVRRDVFETIGGFDEKRYRNPSIEDIELGYRLRKAGFAILLDKSLQGKHLKRWNLFSLLRTDVARRAVPWARLILETGKLPSDLNLKMGQRVSFGLTALALLCAALSPIAPRLFILGGAAMLVVLFLNRDLYAFFLRRKGFLFAAQCVPLHLLYFVYSGFSYLYAWCEFQLKRNRCPSESAVKGQPV